MKGYLKKAFAVMMAGVMVCGILTGCGSKKEETKAETTAETGAESAADGAVSEVKTVEEGSFKGCHGMWLCAIQLDTANG